MSLRNEISNVGKDTGITVNLRLGRIRHVSTQIYFPKGRTGNGSPTQAFPYPVYFVTIISPGSQFIRQPVAGPLFSTLQMFCNLGAWPPGPWLYHCSIQTLTVAGCPSDLLTELSSLSRSLSFTIDYVMRHKCHGTSLRCICV